MKQYKIDNYLIKTDSTEKAVKIYKKLKDSKVKDSNPAVRKTTEYLWTWEKPYEFEFKTLQELNFYYVDLRKEVEQMLRSGYEIQKKFIEQKLKDSLKDANSDLTNIRVLKKEKYKDFDEGGEHTLSLVEYIPQGNVDDGSMRKLWAVIRDYNGEKVWVKGAIISVSERLGRESFDHQLRLHKIGSKAYLRGDSIKDEGFIIVEFYRSGNFDYRIRFDNYKEAENFANQRKENFSEIKIIGKSLGERSKILNTWTKGKGWNNRIQVDSIKDTKRVSEVKEGDVLHTPDGRAWIVTVVRKSPFGTTFRMNSKESPVETRELTYYSENSLVDSISDMDSQDVMEFETALDSNKITYRKIGNRSYSGLESQFDKIDKIAKKLNLKVRYDHSGSGHFSLVDSISDMDINQLSAEEQKAIDDYKAAIAETKDPELLNLFAHILKEEIEHLEELNNAKEGEFEDSVKDANSFMHRGIVVIKTSFGWKFTVKGKQYEAATDKEAIEMIDDLLG